ncbi:MAG: amino acid permease [Candidatus Eremiobacteraeota bacterium]|nr:amino acid permease [Candidatus Eremiobacteraeota bacterium]
MPQSRPTLARRLGVSDAVLVVMGGIIGSGIFMNPAVVARYVHTTPLILGVWGAGGFVALLGAFLFAELGARRPSNGGLYAYMRDAYHPVVAFMYGWTLLLVSQSGGMAAASVTFGNYFEPLTGLHVASWILPVVTLGLLTIVNCLGVKGGSITQNIFMLLKIGAIVALIVAGVFFAPGAQLTAANTQVFSSSFDLLSALGLAMIPVLFSYSGWQTASFMTGELKNPARTLPLGMIWGVVGVVILYMLVNIVSVKVLGTAALAQSHAPASDVMRVILGPLGARLIALVIALSTLGFLSNQMLTSPRVYHAMAQDGNFFPQVAWVHPKTRVPMIAIALQGVVAIAIALSGRYDQILNYVTSVDYIFFGLSAIALFIFRRRDRNEGAGAAVGFRMPGYPWTTALFLIVAWTIVLDVFIKDPRDSLGGLVIIALGIPVYYGFARLSRASNG